MRKQPGAIQQLLHGAGEGFYKLLTLDEDSLVWTANFVRKYRKLNPQLADACLAYLAERDGIDTIFTLDRKDFSVYRYRSNRRFKLLPPPY